MTMDNFVAQIADHALSDDGTMAAAPVVHACKRRILDTLGCAIAAFDAEPSRIARALAIRISVGRRRSVLGTE